MRLLARLGWVDERAPRRLTGEPSPASSQSAEASRSRSEKSVSPSSAASTTSPASNELERSPLSIFTKPDDDVERPSLDITSASEEEAFANKGGCGCPRRIEVLDMSSSTSASPPAGPSTPITGASNCSIGSSGKPIGREGWARGRGPVGECGPNSIVFEPARFTPTTLDRCRDLLSRQQQQRATSRTRRSAMPPSTGGRSSTPVYHLEAPSAAGFLVEPDVGRDGDEGGSDEGGAVVGGGGLNVGGGAEGGGGG